MLLFRKKQEGVIARLAHDLRAPLHTVNGYLDLLLLQENLHADGYELALRARAGSERLYTLLENLLLEARLELETARFQYRPINVQELIIDALEEVEVAAQEKQIEFNIHGEDEIYPLFGDQLRLQQVLRNLSSLAVEEGREGSMIRMHLEQVEREQKAWLCCDLLYQMDAGSLESGERKEVEVARKIVLAHQGVMETHRSEHLGIGWRLYFPLGEKEKGGG